jgi:N6-L-threonylcarbamoyladenine synthase
MRIIGIESSHDDSSIALLENGEVKKMITYSQYETHQKYGGVVPELASRDHVNNLSKILDALKKFDSLNDIDYIAYTNEPGLIGPLKMGYLFASALAYSLECPLIPINHLIGHVFSGSLTNVIVFPALALLASGGHTQLIYLKSVHESEVIGQTQDDSVGEAYDKVARVLGLEFPGGPKLDLLAQEGSGEIEFSIPMQNDTLNFSYSGLKAQVINFVHNSNQKNEPINSKSIAVAFQKSAINHLLEKTKLALKQFDVKTLVLGGGVSANSLLRKKIINLHENVVIPDLKYSTDNAAMIAKAAELQIAK